MNRTLCLAALAACTGVACDGQVDSDYRGEPLMTLSGDIIADGPLAGDLEPAFVFRKQQDDADFNLFVPTGTQTNVFLRGQVTGSFPNAFTMTLFDPPPASVLYHRFKGEALVAVAEFVAVPRGHPAELTSRTRKEPNPQGTSEFPIWDRKVQLCSETGDCIENELPCGEDPSRSESDFPCGPRIPERPSWETWGYSRLHHVVYAAEPVAAGSYTARLYNSGNAMPVGYYLVVTEVPPGRGDPDAEPPSTPESEACWRQREQAREERVRESGVDVSDSRAYGELFDRWLVDYPCPSDPKFKVVANTQSVTLTLTTEPWDPWLSI